MPRAGHHRRRSRKRHPGLSDPVAGGAGSGADERDEPPGSRQVQVGGHKTGKRRQLRRYRLLPGSLGGSEDRFRRVTKEGSQEAHEAIRPTDPTAGLEGIAAEHAPLYDLIRRRLLASQMTPAKIRRTRWKLSAPGPSGSRCSLRCGAVSW